MVRWEDVSKGMNSGGVGIRRLGVVNACLLVKWLWKFGEKENSLWKKVLCCKYNYKVESWFPNLDLPWKCSKVWHDILSVGALVPSLLPYFFHNVGFAIGDGSRMSFWKHAWHSNSCLQDEFPRLFSLSLQQDFSVKMMWESRLQSSEWSLIFRRPLLAWEEEDLARLRSALLVHPPIRQHQRDKMVWKANSSGIFSVNSLYSWYQQSLGDSIPYLKFVWNKLAPPKAQFFGWLAWRGRIKTSELLQRIGVLPNHIPYLCCFCNENVETMEHILLWCPFIWRLWANMMRWWGMLWVIPGSIQDLLQWWDGHSFKNLSKKLWSVIPVAIFWSVWKLRNDCIFNKCQPNWDDFSELIKVRIALWIKSGVKNINYTVSDFVHNLDLIRGVH